MCGERALVLAYVFTKLKISLECGITHQTEITSEIFHAALNKLFQWLFFDC